MTRTKTSNFTIRLDSKLKEDAEKLFSELGMNLSTALNVFLHQALIAQGLPFQVKRKQPNKATLAAMKEAIELANDPNAEVFSSIKELMEDLES